MDQMLVSFVKRWESPLRIAVELALIISIALLGARLVWLVASPELSVASFTNRALPSPYLQNSGNVSFATDRATLLGSNPFSAAGGQEIVVQDAPETNLNLRLLGVFASNSPNRSGTAFIRTSDNQTKRYAIGDEIIPGVGLVRVLSDRVIIDRDGANEALMLSGRGAGLTVIGDGSQSATALSNNDVDESAPIAEEANAFETGQALSPIALFGAIQFSVETSAGSPTGYRLSSRGNVSEMQRAGLQPGDLLLRVNGINLVDIDSEELLERLDGLDSAILQVQRDGVVRTIRLDFEG